MYQRVLSMRNSKKFFFIILVLGIILLKISWDKYAAHDVNLFDEEERFFQIKQTNNTIYIPTIYRDDCKVLSIDSLKNFSRFNNFPNGIARILHYVANEEDISKAHWESYKKCGTLNKDMRLVHWTDASFYRVFVTQFDRKITDAWKSTFSSMDDPTRAAIIRAMVLMIFGGVSLSLDTVCNRSIGEVMPKDSCFLSKGNTMKANIEFNRDHDFGESVIGCQRNHGFLRSVVKNKMKVKVDRFYLTDSVRRYEENTNENPIVRLDEKIAQQILPKAEMERICVNVSTELKREAACKSLKGLKATDQSKAAMIHQPVYGVSNIQIVANDVCSMGFPVHIVII